MRKLFSGVCIMLAFTGSYAQPLFSFGPNKVSRDEFLRQFNRNLNPKEDRAKAMQEYLPLFINYKLKVKDAYDMRLDTQFNQKNELADFRRQIEDNYFSEAANSNALVQEAFNRSQRDLHLMDIIIGFDPKNPQREHEAEEAAEKAMHKLEANTDYDKVFDEFCNDKEFRDATHGDLGWVTVFSLPYKVENQVYKLKLGQFTEPIKTSRAFHIFKLVGDRKALGKVKVSQILFAYQPGSSDIEKKAVLDKAGMVYEKLAKGEDFGSQAKIYSMDKTSYQNGGLLPEFGVGNYDLAFENAAFALKNKGDISMPFATSYGIHILKLMDLIPVSTDKNDGATISALKQKVVTDNRMEEAKTNLVKSLLPKIGYKPSKTLNHTSLWKYTDSAFAGRPTAVKDITPKTVLFSFTKEAITAADWMMFVKAVRGSISDLDEKAYAGLLDRYLNVTAAEYYKKHLEEFNPEFRNQLQEFKDANLNFEITEKKVWNKAAEDNAGLLKHYNANKEKYKWAPSVNAIIVTGTDRTTTQTARQQMEANIDDWRKIAGQYENKLLADSNRFEQNQVPVEGKVDFKAHMFTPVITNAQDSSQTFCYIVNVVNETGQRSFEEARGFVINDYQQVLEEKWLTALKKKYPVVVNNAVWRGMLK
ncbi:MAG: peptidylprolyl isomerase [Chitinophagaceae bacterium]